MQSSFRSQEIHSKWRYKTGFCSVILGDFASFRNYKGFRIIFLKILDAIYPFTNVKIFLIPLSITVLNLKVLCFVFLFTWGVKCDKLSFRKSQGIYEKVSKIVHEWNGYGEIFSRPQVIENSRQYCFSDQIFYRKQSLGAPGARSGGRLI